METDEMFQKQPTLSQTDENEFGYFVSLSEAENELVRQAHKKFGKYFENAHNLVFLVRSFIADYKPDAFVFLLFLPQVTNSLFLSFISILRDHLVQHNHMLRHALESAVLAAYALCDTDVKHFGEINDKNILIQNDKVREMAYKWIETNYKNYSDKIKNMKDNINESYAHANILLTSANASFGKRAYESSYFDKDLEYMNEYHLWKIANVAYGLLSLFSFVIKNYQHVTLIKDFNVKMMTFGKENEHLKRMLQNQHQK